MDNSNPRKKRNQTKRKTKETKSTKSFVKQPRRLVFYKQLQAILSRPPSDQYTTEQKWRYRKNRAIAIHIRRLKRKTRQNNSYRIKSKKRRYRIKTKKRVKRRRRRQIAKQPTDDDVLKEMIVRFKTMNIGRRKLLPARYKFIHLTIKDILAKTKLFWSKEFLITTNYIHIVGTIVGVYTNITDKIQLIVEDTTGRITCIIEPRSNKYRRRLKLWLESQDENRANPKYKPSIPKSEFINIAKESDKDFLKRTKENLKYRKDVTREFAYYMMQSSKPYLVDQHPVKSNLQIQNCFGKHVSLTGKVYDWPEQRIVYVWDIKYITMEEFFISLGDRLPNST